MKPFFALTLLCVFFISCEKKKLDLKTIHEEDLLIEQYHISEITTMHQFIDITNKRWDKVERIMEANDHTVDSVILRNDTIYLKLNQKDAIIYDLAAIKFGYKIVLIQPSE